MKTPTQAKQQLLLLWLLLLGASIAASCGGDGVTCVCPIGTGTERQPVISECGVLRAKGRCDPDLACRPVISANTTCTTALSCSAHGEACVCKDRFTCRRRLQSGKAAVLLCDSLVGKRQEAHVDSDGSDDAVVDRDQTAAFFLILVVIYMALLCVLAIYI